MGIESQGCSRGMHTRRLCAWKDAANGLPTTQPFPFFPHSVLTARAANRCNNAVSTYVYFLGHICPLAQIEKRVFLTSFLGNLTRYTPHPSTMVVNTDPSNQQHAIVVVCIVAPTICTLFVAMRIWTRIFVSHSIIGRDDCKLPSLCLHLRSWLSLPDTLQMLDSRPWSVPPRASAIPIAPLITPLVQPLAIAHSVLIALGAFWRPSSAKGIFPYQNCRNELRFWLAYYRSVD